MRDANINKEFWTQPITQKMQNDTTRLMALALLTYADEEGYFYLDDHVIRGALMPRNDLSKVNDAIHRLQQIGYIEFLQHSKRGAIARVVNFSNYQILDRSQSSKIKPQEGGVQ